MLPRRHLFVGLLTALCILYPLAAAAAPKPQASPQLAPDGADQSLEARAFTLEDQGRPREAEPLLRQALDQRRNTFGEKDRRTAAGYASLALNLDVQSRDAEAETYFRKALAIQRAALGDKHPDVGMTLNNLASCLNDQGRRAEAEPLLRKALAIAQANAGESGLATAAVYGNLALNLEGAGHRAEAEPMFRRALEINRKVLGDRHPAVAAATTDLASNVVGQGRYADAEPLYRLALDIDRKTFGDGHYRVATDLDRLAADLDEQGRPMEAESLYRRALEIRRGVFGEANRSTAASYGAVADNLRAQGRYADAEPLYRKALEIRAAAGGNPAELAMDYQNLATNLDDQGRHKEAEPLLRKALDMRRAALGERRDATASAYSSLADNLDAQDRHGDAERMHRRALDIYRSALGEQHPETATAYASLAANLNRQGRYDAAEPLYRKTLEIRRATLGEHHPQTAEAYDALAQTLYLRYDHGQAEPLSARAVAIVRERRNADLHAASADSAGEAAIRRARAAADRSAQDSRIFARHLRIAWLAAKDRPARLATLRDDAFTTAQDLDTSPAAQALAQTVARAAAHGGGADVARQRQALSGQVRRMEGDLVRSLAGGDASEPARLRLALDNSGRQLAALDARLRRANPRYAELTSQTPLTLVQVQQRLRPGEGLLLIVPTGEDVHVFAVSRTRISWNRLFARQADIDRRIRTLRCQVDDGLCDGVTPSTPDPAGRLPPFDLDAAYGLYRDLIAPVEDALPGVDRLLVTTSGSLADLPLAMLTTAPPTAAKAGLDALATAPWLSTRYALTTLPSVSNLRTPGASPAAPGRRLAFLGFGNPAVTGPRQDQPRRRGGGAFMGGPGDLRRGLPPLPGAAKELRAMADALGAAPDSVRMGAQATEASVKTSAALSRANVVAFATHGLQSNEVKGIGEPSLVFTPPAKISAQDDGLLTASEAAQLKLTADWVILSACNTAGADGSPGADATSGLTRAFLYAGAKALLASHWHVFDDATAALTVETLTLQRANPRLTKSQALQRAMAAVRTGRRANGSRVAGWTPEWAHPAYWAPFVLISAGG